MPGQPLQIHVVADSTGETAARLARAAQAQFPNHPFVIVRHPRVTSRQGLRLIFDEIAAQPDADFAIVSTMVNPDLRDLIDDSCAELGIPHCDLIGPALQQLELATGQRAARVAQRPVGVEADYFSRISAMEFAVRHDDGQMPSGLKSADIVLVAASRCGKTPLSMYLGYLGYKTANVPLVAGIEPPAELFEVDRWRLVGLKLDPERMATIRSKRVKALGEHRRADGYADLARIYDEFEQIASIHRRLGCPVLDTTSAALEESASRIIDVVDNRAKAVGARLRHPPGHLVLSP